MCLVPLWVKGDDQKPLHTVFTSDTINHERQARGTACGFFPASRIHFKHLWSDFSPLLFYSSTGGEKGEKRTVTKFHFTQDHFIKVDDIKQTVMRCLRSRQQTTPDSKPCHICLWRRGRVKSDLKYVLKSTFILIICNGNWMRKIKCLRKL